MSAVPLVVCGVSGCGKSTVGRAFAERVGRPFFDADDFHPPANIAKMSGGQPLNDEDRRPWLDALADLLRREPTAVLACSALKRVYRDRLRVGSDAAFVLLDCDRDTLLSRMSGRDHFMPVELLDSQLATLEPLGEDEPGVTLNGARTVEQLVQDIKRLT